MSFLPPFSYYTTPEQRERGALHSLRAVLETEDFASLAPPDAEDEAAIERALGAEGLDR
jgi:hypothetical protein